MKQKMWAYLMHLSDNMWGDPGSMIKIAPYQPELTTDDKIWKDTIDFLPTQGFNTVLIDIGDAIQYETHPEISVKGAWSKDKLKAELNRMRAMGLTPLPKLNFSAGHDAWLGEYSRMLSTSTYYQVCKDLILEVAEVFGNPEYFHLGILLLCHVYILKSLKNWKGSWSFHGKRSRITGWCFVLGLEFLRAE